MDIADDIMNSVTGSGSPDADLSNEELVRIVSVAGDQAGDPLGHPGMSSQRAVFCAREMEASHHPGQGQGKADDDQSGNSIGVIHEGAEDGRIVWALPTTGKNLLITSSK